ncbi:MAG: hypothetical protein FVQ83_16310 [Chloroflexi bacterium]|nr:hypothetical protein [Chloroflexota bacterium]
MHKSFGSPTIKPSINSSTHPKKRLFFLIVIISFFALALLSCNYIQNLFGGVDSPVLDLLRFIPDTSDYRRYVYYGDADAWHTSWDIPRIDDYEELEGLDRESLAFWMRLLPEQTTPPQSLGTQYLRVDDQRGYYGFDIFVVDRYLEAGSPPETITVIEHNIDQDQIAEALDDSGYDSESLDPEGELYSINEDYEIVMDFPTRSGALGNLNRILLLDSQLILAKATEVIDVSVEAYTGEQDSLAENPDYIAAVSAIEDLEVSETSELVGMMFMDGDQLSGMDIYITAIVGSQASQEVRDTVQADLEDYSDPELPTFSLAAFATRHTNGETYLILAVVFPEDEDPESAAEILANRMENYVSIFTGRDFSEFWDLELFEGVQAAGLPVAVVVMRADDPPPTPDDEPMVNTYVISWLRMLNRRDTLFLVSE